MSAPRRYRLALRAYPARYRKSRGRELLATLADGDDERGGPSGREATALAYRGLLERGRPATTGDGLLAMAAGLVLFTMFFGLTWAEREFAFGDGVRVLGNTGPSTWSAAVLLIGAFAVLAAGPFRAVDSPGRRRRAAVVAFFLALVMWSAPGSGFKHLIPDPGALWQVWWSLENIHFQWKVTLPFAAATSVGTWLTLGAVSRLSPMARRRALAAGLSAAAAVVLISVWTRPGLNADYDHASFDVGAAVFVTAAGMLLALAAAYVGSRSRSRPSAARRPSSD